MYPDNPAYQTLFEGHNNSFSTVCVMIPSENTTEPYIIGACREVMDPFNHFKDVGPYRSYIAPETLARTAANVGLDTTKLTTHQLVVGMNIFRKNTIYHLDDVGIYVWSASNPAGKWHAWCLDSRFIRTDTAGNRHPVLLLKVEEWASAEGHLPLLYPWWFPQRFAVVVDRPKPAWLESHDFHEATDADPPCLVPNPRFLPMLYDILAKIPDHLVIPVRYF